MSKKLIFPFILLIIVIFSASIDENFSDSNTDKPMESAVQEIISYKKASSDSKSVIKDIVSGNISSSMTEYDKVKTIHDYIIIHTNYDTSEEIPDSSFSPEGVLINGVAVCQGYAEAFQLFMDYLGIDCQIVKGTAGGVSHAWNAVKVNGEWYNIDTTWDDPIVEEQAVTGTDNLSYSYFLKPDEIFDKDHTASVSHPSCTSTTYLYMEQYYGIPYVIMDTIDDIPEKFMEYYKNGSSNLTMYFPENMNPADTSLLADLYKELYQQEGEEVSFKYYPVSRYLDYSYITIFIE